MASVLAPSPASVEILEDMRNLMRAGKIRVPSSVEKVYKDECMYSFDTPLSLEGLYVNLHTWLGFGYNFLHLDKDSQAGALYLRLLWRRVPRLDTNAKSENVSRLAIGVEGGFLTDSQRYDIVKEYAIAVKSGQDSPVVLCQYPDIDDRFPTLLCQAADAIIAHQGAAEQAEVSTWEADQEIPISKYAEKLPMENNGIRISNDPKTWKCADSGQTDNIWLNLGTGYIGSGRRNWDGTGGTGAALRHYQDTGRKYPLVVKLGTITPQGADVYSYAEDEDSMVKDPWLPEHLSRWGIDVMSQQKTDKTVSELEVELNKSYDFSKITEAGKKLKPLYGPRYTGLKNLGNSCYINSCLQLISALPEVEIHYGEFAEKIFIESPPDPSNDFRAQMAKVVSGLLSGKYSQAPSNKDSMAMEIVDSREHLEEAAPRMFRQLVGRGHAEFSTGQQQDAVEYMQHLLQWIERSERPINKSSEIDRISTHSMFQFKCEDRQMCLRTNMVRYQIGSRENILSLKIPVEAAINRAEIDAYNERESKRQKTLPTNQIIDNEEVVRPVVPLSACLDSFAATEYVQDFVSTAAPGRGMASKQQRFVNFPRYLMIQLKRYYFEEGQWTPKKLDAEVDVPDFIDLSQLRARGILHGEVPLPEQSQLDTTANVSITENSVQPDEIIVSQLLEMGLNLNGSKRAAVATCNINPEAAMEWYFEHANDANFENPMEENIVGTEKTTDTDTFDPSAINELCSFGFSRQQATAALIATNGALDRAADWLFSHSDDLDEAVAAIHGVSTGNVAVAVGSDEVMLDDGEGKYTLMGFISHIGKSLSSGHYVAHIKKEGKWVIYNDLKVAVSEETPLRYGYLYLYRRDDAPM